MALQTSVDYRLWLCKDFTNPHLAKNIFACRNFHEILYISVHYSDHILNVNFCYDTKFEVPCLSLPFVFTAKRSDWTNLLDAQAEFSLRLCFFRRFRDIYLNL